MLLNANKVCIFRFGKFKIINKYTRFFIRKICIRKSAMKTSKKCFFECLL